MSQITIEGVTKEDTAWRKEITFEREGETHLVTLYWSSEDGYDLVFKNETNQTPEWAYERLFQGLEDSLEYVLDSLTEDIIERSYL